MPKTRHSLPPPSLPLKAHHDRCAFFVDSRLPSAQSALVNTGVTPMTIVETSANQFFAVSDVDGIEHAWSGYPVKLVRGQWLIKSSMSRLVRKAGSRIIKA
jgi:hypothetical protein